MATTLDIIWRSVLAFAVMMVITRALGKSTIAQMTYHDFIAAITLGGITANLAFNDKSSVWHFLAALITFGCITYLLMIFALKSRGMRKWLSGQPTVLIQSGKILEENMRKMKLTLDTLNQELREKNIFDINEVEYAVLELNGKVSALKKQDNQPVVKKDLHLAAPRQSFPIELVMDGKLIEQNFRQTQVSKEWLMSQLKAKGLSLQSVNYAVKSTDGNLYIDPYKDRIQQPLDKE